MLTRSSNISSKQCIPENIEYKCFTKWGKQKYVTKIHNSKWFNYDSDQTFNLSFG